MIIMVCRFEDLHWEKDIRIKDYIVPRTLDEALEILAEKRGQARVVAGATDLVPQLRRREMEVETLVDITRLPNMNSVEKHGDHIALGGLVTHAQISASRLIREECGLLAEAATCVGSPQIRNIATVAGNLVSGQPAADLSIPLLALKASVTICSKEGERQVSLDDFFLSPGQTILDSRKEILTSIHFCPLRNNEGGAFLRLSQRKALSLPMLVAAAIVRVDRNRRAIEDASIALGPVAPKPYRPLQCEAKLRGAFISRDTVQGAAEIAMNESNPRDSSLRGSSRYRREMVRVFVQRGLERALEQTGFPLNLGGEK